MSVQKNKILIVGKGNFGEFIGPHLKNFFNVEFYDPQKGLSVVGNIDEIDILVFSIPLESLEESAQYFSKIVSPKALIFDVTSVKVEPLNILKKYFPNNEIIGTHPIFGPQSGKNGITGLTIVLSNLTASQQALENTKHFLSEKLGLKVIEKTPDEHDQEMAYVQGLSHFIGRAIAKMGIQEYVSQTSSYKQLVSLKNLVGSDSWELYKTIQNGNKYTRNVRLEFLKEIIQIEHDLEEELIKNQSEQ